MSSRTKELVKIFIYDRSKVFREQILSLQNSDPILKDNWTVISEEPLPSLKNAVETHKIDAIVSPGNSFGFMDGGFDQAISEYYSHKLKDLLQTSSSIRNDYSLTPLVQEAFRETVNGFNPPGNAMIIDLSRQQQLQLQSPPVVYELSKVPKLIHCATMIMPTKIPQDYPVVFNCTWSILTAIHNFNMNLSDDQRNQQITSVLLSGLGTGYGKIPPKSSATQMLKAYTLFAENLQRTDSLNLNEASQFNQAVYNSLA